MLDVGVPTSAHRVKIVGRICSTVAVGRACVAEGVCALTYALASDEVGTTGIGLAAGILACTIGST